MPTVSLAVRQTPEEKRQMRAESLRRIEAARQQAQVIVATGRCPQCGRGLRRNSSLAGWFQCEQFGAIGFRADSSLPSCDFQCFTV